MPKMKSHRGAAKRFKKTGTGKIVRNRANKQLTIRLAVPGCKQQKLNSRSLSTRRRRSAILRRVSAEPKKAHRERYRRCRRCTAPCAKRTDRRKRFASSSHPSKNSGNELQPANRQIKINLSERPASKVAKNCCTATIRDTSGFKRSSKGGFRDRSTLHDIFKK